MDHFLIDRIRALSATLEPIPTDVSPRLRTVDGIRVALFDIYGTMFISGSGDIGCAGSIDHQEALSAALRAAGFSLKREAAMQGSVLLKESIAAAHGKRKEEGIAYPEIDIRAIWNDVLHRLIVDGMARGTVSDSTLLRVAVEYECRTNPVWPMPGAEECLRVLRAGGIRLGIVSNAQFYTPLLFEALLGRSYDTLGFEPDWCVWSYMHLEAKPSTHLFTIVLQELEKEKIRPEECIYIGNDMLNDIWAASQMGCKTALFAGDQRSVRARKDDNRCLHLEPDVMVTILGQLNACVRTPLH